VRTSFVVVTPATLRELYDVLRDVSPICEEIAQDHPQSREVALGADGLTFGQAGTIPCGFLIHLHIVEPVTHVARKTEVDDVDGFNLVLRVETDSNIVTLEIAVNDVLLVNFLKALSYA